MAHHPEDQHYPHLPLLVEEPNPERRRQQAPPSPPPNRSGRNTFAGELRTRLNAIEEEADERPAPPAGIQPHLVFRVPLAGTISPQSISELLERVGIGVVSIERDNAIVAFRDDVNLAEFRAAVDSYEHGPQDGINPQTGRPYDGTQWDLLEYIEAAQMRLWGRGDRIGCRLAHDIGEDAASIDEDELYVLDVELWHRGTQTLAQVALSELQQAVENNADEGERICDTFHGELLCLARIVVRGPKLDSLLNLDVIAELELPSQPVFDHRVAAQVTEREFPSPAAPPENGPSVCIVDSGIASNHPLLRNHIGHAEAILTTNDTTSDEYGHGTLVGGVAVFGDVRACYEQGQFQSAVTLYSARVLNNENRFDDQSLIIHQMEEAIQFFSRPPYQCRVFNLSLGDFAAWLPHNPRQSLWAESLDTLAREQKVLLVVSAGNHDFGWANRSDEAEEVLDTYPNFLFDPECGLCEPATAAIPLTVGGIAMHARPSVRSARQNDDLLRVVAEPGQPLPTTRIGPGLNAAIKPEFVAHAGNVAFEGFSSLRRIRDNPGIAVMTTSHQPLEGLFAYDIGTSLAAPVVARQAATVWNVLRDYIGAEPQPNLVRAVLATAAGIPKSLYDLVQPGHGDEGVRQIAGYGLIDEDLALDSADRRVTLVAQDRLRIDSFAIFEVPVPPEFRQAPGDKRVIVSLAFDPPVRRRRAEYLGVRMDYALIRGRTVDEIVEAYRAISTDERRRSRDGQYIIPRAFQDASRCNLQPGSRTLRTSTLQRSEWTFKRENRDYGDSWYLVVKATRSWAPESITHQTFGAAVVLEADEPRLYNLVRQRIQVQQQLRARARG